MASGEVSGNNPNEADLVPDLLEAMGGHEVQFIAAAIAVNDPAADTPQKVRAQLVERQGVIPAWRMNNNTHQSFYGHCERGLGAVALARQREAEGATNPALAHKRAAAKVLAFSGALIDWGFAEDMSVQTILSSSPLPRFKLYAALLAAGRPLTYRELHEATEINHITQSINLLARKDILTLKSPTSNLDTARFSLDSSIMNDRPYAGLTLKVVDALRTLYKTHGATEYTMANLGEALNNSVWITKLRAVLSNLQAQQSGVTIIPYERTQEMLVTIAPPFMAPIDRLRANIQGLHDPSTEERFSALAVETISSPLSMYQLMERSRIASGAYGGVLGESPQELAFALMAIAHKLESFSVSQAIKIITKNTGRTFDTATVKDQLEALLQEGRLAHPRPRPRKGRFPETQAHLYILSRPPK